ncbi:dicarboxylate/amino acid:cation symporter [Isosphaeraceae bacterium EP7]
MIRMLNFASRIPFVAQILVGMVLGALLGHAIGPRAAPLGELGAIVIGLIKALAAPLLFFAVIDAFMRSELSGRSGARMVGISMVNGGLAIVIGMALSQLMRPGDHLRASMALRPIPISRPELDAKPIDFIKELSGYVPKNVVQPFLEGSVLSIVLIALMAGLALRMVKVEQQTRGEGDYLGVERAVATFYRASELLIGWVIRLIPLAIFGVVAQTVGRYGFGPIVGLAYYVLVVLLGLSIQVLVVYQGWLYFSGISLRRFWSKAKEPVIYAMGASSSLATLPVTLKSLDEMGVSTPSARLSACVGTNLNNDGILLYEAMAVLVVAHAYGIELSPLRQLAAALACVVASVGIAGIPDAGLISLPIVLATVGLPLEIVSLLLSVDWILSRGRAMTNVTSDMVVAVMLDRFEGHRLGERMTEGEGEKQ